ncbi:MAG: DNA primase [Clostridium sp.]|nr:DNA primase [Clostridium sp.]
MIDRATVDRILDAAQIVDVVSDFVTLKRAGANYKGLCPFHEDRTPSFVVSPAKGLCKCFACGKGGNAVHFIMEHEQLSFPDALRYLAKKYHIEIKEKELTDEEQQARNERESMFIVNEWACSFFRNQLTDTVDGRAIGMAYFRNRGFRDDIITKFQLGFSPNQWDALLREARTKGYRDEYLLKTGLCIQRDNGQLQDRFRGRVIFPVFTLSGKVVAFGGRVLDAATKGVNIKYQNSPESSIYSKKRELYGLFQAKQSIVKNDLCYLVEGYTDVISMHQAGVENVVASSGTALTTDQIRLIHRFTDNITVIYDGDAAGIKASERGIDMLLAEGMNVKLLLLPDGDDPDSFARKHNATEYQAYLNEHQVDFIKFKTDLLLQEAKGDPIRLSRLVNNIVQSISVIPDEITRTLYTRETSAMLAMDEQMLAAAVGRCIVKAREDKKKQQEQEYNRKAQQQTHTAPSSSQAAVPASGDGDTPPPPDIDRFPPDFPPEESVPTTESTSETVQTLSFIPRTGAEDMLFYEKELLLVQALVRYGDKVMCNVENENGEEQPLTVIEYIRYTLDEDALQFHNPLHNQLLEEAEQHLNEPGFTTERYFMNHPSPAISSLAFELMSDRYILSKYHSKSQKVVSNEERLVELLPHLMADFKLAIVDEELKQILLQLRRPDILQDKERYMDIMKHYKEVKEIESSLARQRGDRVLTIR